MLMFCGYHVRNISPYIMNKSAKQSKVCGRKQVPRGIKLFNFYDFFRIHYEILESMKVKDLSTKYRYQVLTKHQLSRKLPDFVPLV